MIGYAVALAILAPFCPAQQAPRNLKRVAGLVVVSGNAISSERLAKIMDQPDWQAAQSSLGSERFRHLKQEKFDVLVDEAAFGLDNLKNRVLMLEAFSEALKEGSATIRLDSLPSDKASALRSVLAEQSKYINEGMRHLLGNPNLKVSLEPVVTSRFEGGGRTQRVSATVVNKNKEVITQGDVVPSPSAAPAPPLGGPFIVENAVHYYFSTDFGRPSHRLKAMLEVATLTQRLLDTEIAAFEAAFSATRALLFAKYGDTFGGGTPPSQGDFSSLPSALQAAFVRDAMGSYSHMGFDSPVDAENWLRGSRMVSSNAYINFVIGGLDQKSGRVTIGSLVFPRP